MIPLKNKPLFLQVEEFVRAQIISGAYPAHTRLPSTRGLAALTGTSFCTVQTALSKLCREGLLESRVGRGGGTYVIGDRAKLTCAGLYLRRPISRSESAFYPVLNQELQRRLSGAGVKVRVWSDERGEEEFPGPPDSLVRAMEKQEIQGLIAPLVTGYDLEWLQKTPVPSAVLTTDITLKNGVGSNFRGMLRQGLEELKRQGCRSVGILSNLLLHADDAHSAEFDFYHSLIDLTNELDLKIQNEWIRFPEQYTPHFAHFGHEQFHALWDLEDRPDGLLVYPDESAPGVIMAILERRLNVPHDLKVVFHVNDLIPYVCPFDATYLCTGVGSMADALIDMVRTQLEGREVSPVQIPTSIVRNADPFQRKITRASIPI